MVTAAKVLSLSPDPHKLAVREDAIRSIGLEAKSVNSAVQARFEIEMGRCQVFITCRLVSDIVNRDLMRLVRRTCPRDSFIIFVDTELGAGTAPFISEADVTLAAADDPHGIIAALRSRI